MATKFLLRPLLKLLALYIKNFNSDQLNLSLLDGVGTLEKVELDCRAIQDALGIPYRIIEVQRMFVNRLSVDVPYSRIKDDPVIFWIDKLEVVLLEGLDDEFMTPEQLKTSRGGDNIANNNSNNSNNSNKVRHATVAQDKEDSKIAAFSKQILDGIRIEICHVQITVRTLCKRPDFVLDLRDLKLLSVNRQWKAVSLRELRGIENNSGKIYSYLYKLINIGKFEVRTLINSGKDAGKLVGPLLPSFAVTAKLTFKRLKKSSERRGVQLDIDIPALMFTLNRYEISILRDALAGLQATLSRSQHAQSRLTCFRGCACGRGGLKPVSLPPLFNNRIASPAMSSQSDETNSVRSVSPIFKSSTPSVDMNRDTHSVDLCSDDSSEEEGSISINHSNDNLYLNEAPIVSPETELPSFVANIFLPKCVIELKSTWGDNTAEPRSESTDKETLKGVVIAVHGLRASTMQFDSAPYTMVMQITLDAMDVRNFTEKEGNGINSGDIDLLYLVRPEIAIANRTVLTLTPQMLPSFITPEWALSDVTIPMAFFKHIAVDTIESSLLPAMDVPFMSARLSSRSICRYLGSCRYTAECRMSPLNVLLDPEGWQFLTSLLDYLDQDCALFGPMEEMSNVQVLSGRRRVYDLTWKGSEISADVVIEALIVKVPLLIIPVVPQSITGSIPLALFENHNVVMKLTFSGALSTSDRTSVIHSKSHRHAPIQANLDINRSRFILAGIGTSPLPSRVVEMEYVSVSALLQPPSNELPSVITLGGCRAECFMDSAQFHMLMCHISVAAFISRVAQTTNVNWVQRTIVEYMNHAAPQLVMLENRSKALFQHLGVISASSTNDANAPPVVDGNLDTTVVWENNLDIAKFLRSVVPLIPSFDFIFQIDSVFVTLSEHAVEVDVNSESIMVVSMTGFDFSLSTKLGIESKLVLKYFEVSHRKQFDSDSKANFIVCPVSGGYPMLECNLLLSPIENHNNSKDSPLSWGNAKLSLCWLAVNADVEFLPVAIKFLGSSVLEACPACNIAQSELEQSRNFSCSPASPRSSVNVLSRSNSFRVSAGRVTWLTLPLHVEISLCNSKINMVNAKCEEGYATLQLRSINIVFEPLPRAYASLKALINISLVFSGGLKNTIVFSLDNVRSEALLRDAVATVSDSDMNSSAFIPLANKDRKSSDSNVSDSHGFSEEEIIEGDDTSSDGNEQFSHDTDEYIDDIHDSVDVFNDDNNDDSDETASVHDNSNALETKTPDSLANHPVNAVLSKSGIEVVDVSTDIVGVNFHLSTAMWSFLQSAIVSQHEILMKALEDMKLSTDSGILFLGRRVVMAGQRLSNKRQDLGVHLMLAIDDCLRGLHHLVVSGLLSDKPLAQLTPGSIEWNTVAKLAMKKKHNEVEFQDKKMVTELKNSIHRAVRLVSEMESSRKDYSKILSSGGIFAEQGLSEIPESPLSIMSLTSRSDSEDLPLSPRSITLSSSSKVGSMDSDGDVKEKKGFLYKRSGTLVKSWNKKICVMSRGIPILYYYDCIDDQPSATPKQCIPIDKAVVQVRKGDSTYKYQFELALQKTEHIHGNYIFAVESEIDFVEWLDWFSLAKAMGGKDKLFERHREAELSRLKREDVSRRQIASQSLHAHVHREGREKVSTALNAVIHRDEMRINDIKTALIDTANLTEVSMDYFKQEVDTARAETTSIRDVCNKQVQSSVDSVRENLTNEIMGLQREKEKLQSEVSWFIQQQRRQSALSNVISGNLEGYSDETSAGIRRIPIAEFVLTPWTRKAMDLVRDIDLPCHGSDEKLTNESTMNFEQQNVLLKERLSRVHLAYSATLKENELIYDALRMAEDRAIIMEQQMAAQSKAWESRVDSAHEEIACLRMQLSVSEAEVEILSNRSNGVPSVSSSSAANGPKF